jgi:hypothetical protein
MSWKSDPKIRELEPYAKRHGYRYVVLFGVNADGTQYSVTTYGTTKQNCDIAKIAGDQLHELVQDSVWPDWDKPNAMKPAT